MSQPTRTDQSEKDWLTPAEATAIFPVTRRTLARAADRGVIIADKTPGGHRRYLRSSILELLGTDKAAS